MKKIRLLALLALAACAAEETPDPSQTLWYDRPAENWTEALPVGNGRIGAMVHGATGKEIIQFNEESLWTGQPHDYAREGAHEYLDSLRKLLWEGKQEEAHALGNAAFMSDPYRQLNYSAFGNIILDLPHKGPVSKYRRELDLQDAITSVSYEAEGIHYQREVFASAPDQALVIRLEASEKGALHFSAALDSPHDEWEVVVLNDELILRGRANNYEDEDGRWAHVGYPESKIRFEARLQIRHEGGSLSKDGSSLTLEGARSATLLLVAATNFVNYQDISADPSERCDDYMAGLRGRNYRKLRQAHLQDYQPIYERMHLDLGASELSHRPTDQRLNSFLSDRDPSLAALLFQYGRYLLITSSRPGTQPANLQGIWNASLAPPWDSKYTININTEMNYWPSEITNLPELSEPLFSLLEDLAVSGKKVAKEHYGLEGWVCHHNTDLWRAAAPINNANHGVWPTGGAWLSQHLWWHYQFNGDKDFLEQRAYPILREASRFFAGYLVPDPKHPQWLVSGPSNSPELGGMVMGPAMDHQIIRNLFSNTMEAAGILDRDPELVAMLREKREKIAPNLVGQHGQLQEWVEDKDDPREKHRHVSHLWGLHPGNEIHPLTTPELAEACRVTLAHRGDGGTGWSRSWKINFWARLLDGDHAFLLLKNLMVPAGSKAVEYGGHAGGLYPNLFCAHPPFQIDGNFGATSGMCEMLLQSHLRDEKGAYYQDLLPALPSAFPRGKLRGIKGRGAFEFSMQWEEGELTSLTARSLQGNTLILRYKGRSLEMNTRAGVDYQFTREDFS